MKTMHFFNNSIPPFDGVNMMFQEMY